MKITKTSLRHFLANVVCAFIYNDMTRKRVRAIINSPYFAWRRFVRRDCGLTRPRIKLLTGFSGRNLIFIAGDKYVYKFIHKHRACDPDIEQREFDIATEFSKISTIPLLIPTILNTSCGPVRRYDFVPGITLRTAAERYPDMYKKYKDSLAQQIANFMYEMARVDPVSLREYKKKYIPANTKPKKPGYMYGWYHSDIGDNFMIDPKTFHITRIIDLESMCFGDFSEHWSSDGCELVSDFDMCVKRHYDEIWNAHQKKRAK